MTEAHHADISAERVDRIACRQCSRPLDVADLKPFSRVECPACHTRQNVPMVLGNFLLIEPLGHGGMGVVYKALDQSLGRYVAIKVLKRALGDDSKFSETFFREARAIAALNHPNIVQIYSVGEEKGQPYMVMELVAGGRLDEIIAKGVPMAEKRAIEIGLGVSKGLEAANEIGLIHADIKPANILFDAKGVAKVVDFGLAQFVNWKQTGPKEIWGTPYYIAPERARGQPMDHRSDIYSLGATLYHALSGEPPFEGQNATAVVLARLKEPPGNLEEIRDDLSNRTCQVVKRMLESDPFLRYPTYKSLQADLNEALQAAETSGGRRKSTSKKKKRSRAPLVLGLLFVLILVAAGAGYFLLRSDPLSPPESDPASEALAEEGVAAEPEGEAAPEESAPVEAEDQAEPEVGLPPLEFSEGEDRLLIEALGNLGNGLLVDARRELNRLQNRNYEERPLTGYWSAILAALPPWLERQQALVDKVLMPVSELGKDYTEEKPAPAEIMLVRDMARWLRDPAQAQPTAPQDAPEWMPPFLQALQGFEAYRQRNLNECRAPLQAYLQYTEEASPAWPRALQPMAKRILSEIQGYKALEASVNKAIAEQAPETALPEIQQFINKSLPVFRDMAAQLRVRAQQAAAAIKAEERAREEQAHQAAVDADLQQLEELRRANLPLLAARDFFRARNNTTAAANALETDEGRAAHALLLKAYQRMDDLKSAIISSVRSRPYQASARHRLGGNITSASNSEIVISLSGPVEGTIQKPWSQVSAVLFAQMGEHSITVQNLDETQKAQHLLSIAVFCYHTPGAMSGAVRYAGMARATDAAIEEQITQLMPELPSE